MKLRYLLFLVWFPIITTAQTPIVHSGSLRELFNEIQFAYGYTFMYNNLHINDNQKISIRINTSNIETAMKEVAKLIDCSFEIRNRQIVLKKNISVCKRDLEKQNSASGLVQSSIFRARAGEASPGGNFSLSDQGNGENMVGVMPLDVDSSILFLPERNMEDTVQREQNYFLADSELLREKPLPGTDFSGDLGITEKMGLYKENNTPGLSTRHKREDLLFPDPDSVRESRDTVMPGKAEEVLKEIECRKERNLLPGQKYIPVPETKICQIALATNLLSDLVITPDLGFELKFTGKFSIIANALWAQINWNNGARCYRIWALMPEIRYYFTRNRRWYAAVQFHMGQINLKLTQTGSQGDYMGGGLICGFVANLTEKLKLDLDLGFGYTFYHYETYHYIKEKNIRDDSGDKNVYSLIKTGVTFKWILN